MPFQKGHPKAGGHPGAGIEPQTKITIGTVKATCERLGCDPFRIMANIAMDPKCGKPLRVKCAAELAQYLAPKLKSVEHTGSVEVAVKRLLGVPEDEV